MSGYHNCLNIIYVLRNTNNSKVYIGQTWRSLKDRWGGGSGYNGCIHLERAIKEHGKNSFYYEILTVCGTQETADYWETYFIEKYNSTNSKYGYNIKLGGLGGKHTPETKAKISAARQGMVFSEEHINNLSESHKGFKPTEETRRKLSIAKSGSNNHFYGKKGALHPLFGIARTPEVKQKVSEATKGKQLGSKHAKTKLTDEDVLSMREMYARGLKPAQILPFFKDKIKLRGLKGILYRQTWKHI